MTPSEYERYKTYWKRSHSKRRTAANEYAKAHYQSIKHDVAKQARKLRIEQPELVILKRVKPVAKKKGLDFNLTIEDIVIPDRCPILDIPLIIGEKQRSDNSPSLDRIDNAFGYVKGNVHVISMRANRIKNDSSLEELEAIVKYFRALPLTQK